MTPKLAVRLLSCCVPLLAAALAFPTNVSAQTCGGNTSCSVAGNAYTFSNSYSSASANGLYGNSTYGRGVLGNSSGGPGVEGTSSNGNGVQGSSTGRNGAQGVSTANGASGVYGENNTSNGYGIAGRNTNTSSSALGAAIYGDNNGQVGTGAWAGYFTGGTYAQWLYKAGGSFLIDHPLDPAHKNLLHSFVESPDMKNIYDGVVVLDASGSATVVLPDWFEALNMDFRYQLTCIGRAAPIYISQEISGNAFSISGGTLGLKVSWQVTGTRHDAFANMYRPKVESAKSAVQMGHYLNPEAFGLPRSDQPINIAP